MSLHYIPDFSATNKNRNKVKKSPMNRMNDNHTERNRYNIYAYGKPIACILGAIAVSISYAIFRTNANYNLFSWDIDNLDWSKVKALIYDIVFILFLFTRDHLSS